MAKQIDLLQGTLDMLILKALQPGAMHGFGISVLLADVQKGSASGARLVLYRLEVQGSIQSEWGVSDNNRKAKFYQLNWAGRKQLVAEPVSF